MWLSDPNNKKKSVTLTLFVLAFVVAVVKLLISGIQIGAFTMTVFSGTDFAAVVGSVGAIYFGRRYSNGKKEVSE